MKETTKKSVVIYVRHSSPEVREGHLLELLWFAASTGLVVEQVFIDSDSAHDASHPSLSALTKATGRGKYDLVLVMAPEALFRGKHTDTELFLQMLFEGVEVITPYDELQSFDETALLSLHK